MNKKIGRNEQILKNKLKAKVLKLFLGGSERRYIIDTSKTTLINYE